MKTLQNRPKIAVIGAGWAGLSAAVMLARDTDLTLFEAGRQPGGRARTLTGDNHGFSFLDNGQHILLGAYHGVLRLMKEIGSNPKTAFLRLPLQWHMHEGLQFRTRFLPAPLHILSGVLLARYFPFTFKTKLLSDMSSLQKFARSDQADMTVGQWLRQRNTPRLYGAHSIHLWKMQACVYCATCYPTVFGQGNPAATISCPSRI